MANNYAIIIYYSGLGGARNTSKCIGTVNSKKKADKYTTLLRMSSINIKTVVRKQKRKISRSVRLDYIMNPENENKIRLSAISRI